MKFPDSPHIRVTRTPRFQLGYRPRNWQIFLVVGCRKQPQIQSIGSRKSYLFWRRADAVRTAFWWAESMVWQGVPMPVVVIDQRRNWAHELWIFSSLKRQWCQMKGPEKGKLLKAKTTLNL